MSIGYSTQPCLLNMEWNDMSANKTECNQDEASSTTKNKCVQGPEIVKMHNLTDKTKLKCFYFLDSLHFSHAK